MYHLNKVLTVFLCLPHTECASPNIWVVSQGQVKH